MLNWKKHKKKYDSIKAKLDFRDEMLDKLMERKYTERSYPERAEDVVGKNFLYERWHGSNYCFLQC